MKRLYIYKRSKVQLTFEVFVPVLMVLAGLIMIKMMRLEDSPAFTIGLDYPAPQHVIFNENVIYDS